MNEEAEPNIRERSRSYPSYTLSESLQTADLVKKNLGGYPSTREDISKAIGSERITGASAKKIATMAQFGLLRKIGSKYALSELYQKIIHPLSADEKSAALIESFNQPMLYAQLVEKLRPSGAIPEHLRTILIRDFDVLEAGSEIAKRVFVESAMFAGVIGPDMKFKPTLASGTDTSGDIQKPSEPPQSVDRHNKSEQSMTEQKKSSVGPELEEYSFNYWDAAERTAKLYLMREMTQDDMDRLKTFLDLQIKIKKKPSTAMETADG